MKYCWVFFVFQEIKNQEIIIDHLKKKKTVPQRKEEQKSCIFYREKRQKERKETKHRPTN